MSHGDACPPDEQGTKKIAAKMKAEVERYLKPIGASTT
jgi:hypothetical protein